jgi:predicted small lipoprotein YifL
MLNHTWATDLMGVMLALSMAGCGPAKGPVPEYPDIGYNSPVTPAQSSPTEFTLENTALVGTPMPLPLGDDTSETIQRARKDLAQRLGVPVEVVTVGAMIGQDFSSDAFYCRTTKERIAREPPAVKAGYVILLQASGRRYEYHANDQTVFFCRPLP